MFLSATDLFDPSGLSDKELDAAYAAYYDAGNLLAAQPFVMEIIDRLSSVWSFTTGIFGHVRFPLYNERGGFQQARAARDTVSYRADELTTAAENKASGVVLSGVKVAAPVLIIGGVLLWLNGRGRK